MLVAALHTRESQDPSKFNRYLHQGDLLGSPCERVPCGKDKTKDDYVPDFAADEWEKAAIHALTMPDKKRNREALGISYATTDLAALATFAEAYNGLGYFLYRSSTSPYAFAGTSGEAAGKYESDGKYTPGKKDKQIGAYAVMASVQGQTSTATASSTSSSAPTTPVTPSAEAKAVRPSAAASTGRRKGLFGGLFKKKLRAKFEKAAPTLFPGQMTE